MPTAHDERGGPIARLRLQWASLEPPPGDRGREVASLRALGVTRALIGVIFLLRTTPLLSPFHPRFLAEATPLLGWPDGGFHAPAFGIALPKAAVAALCVVRTAAAVALALGVRARVAGLVAGTAGYVVLAQDELGFLQTLHLLFASTLLLGFTDAGSAFALRPDPPRAAASSLFLVHAFTASIYFWACLAKLRPDWLDGRALQVFFEARALHGPVARAVTGAAGTRAAAAWGVAIVEMLLGPALLWPRTRRAALAVAFALHATIEITAKADVFGWIMGALLLSYLPVRTAAPTGAGAGESDGAGGGDAGARSGSHEGGSLRLVAMGCFPGPGDEGLRAHLVVDARAGEHVVGAGVLPDARGLDPVSASRIEID